MLMFDNFINNFEKNDSWSQIDNICRNAIKSLTGDNLYHLKSDVSISQNGHYAVFTQTLCLNGGKTKEEIKLQQFMKSNPKIKFDFNKLYIHIDGKVYQLWGYVNKRYKNPFVATNVNNVYDKILLPEDIVIRYFT